MDKKNDTLLYPFLGAWTKHPIIYSLPLLNLT